MKIAICFRGISRSLKTTIESIQKNIFDPASKHADVRVFTHLYSLREINNPRSKENTTLDPNDYKLLQSDWTQIDQPNSCFNLYPINEIKKFGDEWQDEFISFNNLIQALHSLKIGYEAASKWNPDIFVFARPDLYYHDSFEDVFKHLSRTTQPKIHLPIWQSFDGCNDRLAIINSDQLAKIYATRIDHALEYCKSTEKSLSAEVFLFEHLKTNKTPISFLNIKASRVRAGGSMRTEKFSKVRKSNINVFKYYLKQEFLKSI
jgi:hypothetical protein